MKWHVFTQRTFARLRRSRRGQSLVEFAMVAPLFFLLVFGITDYGRLFFTQLTMQYALREAGRYAVTGQKKNGVNPATNSNYTRCESIKAIAQQYASGLLPDSSSVTVRAYDSQGHLDADHCAGLPNETVVVSLTSQLRLITPLIGKFFPQVNGQGVYTFTVSTSFKNEPFDISNAD